ncbi:GTPase IMAP family member 9-like [Micropterus salmoides]|uniref:GTPase IMAP family member 9-like n=1 Tax=Micropterus salmoides TaxID=27706 RepID=UPI0018EC85EA|nr:GTPase IMAP family member 9-like [Micropterus salmoides]
MASEETFPSQLRIALIGKVGVGKTSVMKTLLMSSEEVLRYTEKCQKKEAKIGGQTVVVVDTPGLCKPRKTKEELIEEIKKCVSLTAPGPHVFLFVLNLDRFTKEDQDTVEIIKKTFGEKAATYTMALFTHGDQLKKKGKTIKKFMEKNKDLKHFVDTCKGGPHVIDNKDKTQSEATKLLEKINNMVKENGGKCYTDEMLQEAEKEGKINFVGTCKGGPHVIENNYNTLPEATELLEDMIKEDGGKFHTAESVQEAEKEGESSGLRKRIALSVNGSALAGAGLGGAVTHFVGSAVGIPVGAAAGAAIGGVLGGVGIVTAEHIKAKKCVMQ